MKIRRTKSDNLPHAPSINTPPLPPPSQTLGRRRSRSRPRILEKRELLDYSSDEGSDNGDHFQRWCSSDCLSPKKKGGEENCSTISESAVCVKSNAVPSPRHVMQTAEILNDPANKSITSKKQIHQEILNGPPIIKRGANVIEIDSLKEFPPLQTWKSECVESGFLHGLDICGENDNEIVSEIGTESRCTTPFGSMHDSLGSFKTAWQVDATGDQTVVMCNRNRSPSMKNGNTPLKKTDSLMSSQSLQDVFQIKYSSPLKLPKEKRSKKMTRLIRTPNRKGQSRSMNAADSIRKSNKQRWIQTVSFKEASENILLGVPLKVEKRKLPTEKLSTILKEHNQHGLHNFSPARKLESILKKKKEPKNSETMQKMKKVLQNKKDMKRMYNKQQRQQQNPNKLDVAICGIYQGFDLINLGSSLKLSYIGQKQKTLSGQRYTLRSMVVDSIMSTHSNDPVVVFEGYSVRGQGNDRWSAPIQYNRQKEKLIWGEKVPPSHMTQIKNAKRIQRSASKSDESETVFEVQTLDQLNLAHEHAVEPLQNGDVDEAIHRFMKILRSLQVKYSPTSGNTPENHVIASTLHNIAILHTFNMQFEVALNYITQAVNMRVKCLGYYHSSVAVSFAKQGMIYFALENLGSSVRAFEQALDIQTELSNNSDRIQTSKLLNNIGVVYFHLGEKRNALDRLMRALKLQKQRIDESLSRESSIFDTSITLSNLGKVFLKRREYSMATYVYEEAVMTQTSIFPKDHPVILESLGNVAYSKAMADDKTNALEVYKSLLEMQVKQFGEKSRDIFETKALMGILYTQQSNYSVALRYFNEVYEWQQLNLDSIHPALRYSKTVIDQLTSLVNGDDVAFVRAASSTAAEI
ncbi:hypothetical protein CTEN210_02489 [Chaetoceros tenuissimus]|uniref:Uncharacterized protein n=1 Tax=Chaetoceros tenuissimus TaxID=426638 RepID=A0AAD3CIZ9_9STRA|nr:hypothetical protein CTEN210_02489 [Chaetoceros tenuissimus]